MSPTNDSYLNTKQAAAYTGFAVNTLEKLRCTGDKGPSFRKVRRNVFYLKSELDLWMGNPYKCTVDYA